MITNGPHHIIAIGASAGGMEEINAFFDNTPVDGVSYIIIQHLSPDFKSRMVELLTRHSKLFVEQAANDMEIRVNHVYLIPNDKFMTTRNGRLFLTTKEHVKAPHLTIDIFFKSLAASYGKTAIAIILSGLGVDGTEGSIAVKKAGGMVIARDPETTGFPGMPASAIDTGMVDFVLEPASMPDIIEDYIMHQKQIMVNSEEDERTLITIIDLIKEKLPLDFSDYKLTTLLRRSMRRAAYSNFTRLEDYFEYLKVTPDEVVALAKDFLISVTSFFRDPEAFEFIEKNILPDLLSNLAPGEELKMWIAGCATGEEVYSIAMLIAEQLTGPYQNVPVKLFATDLDTHALHYAGRGVYQWNSVKDVSPERLSKFFVKEKDSYRVLPLIRHMVIFAQHDLVKNPPYCNMHFISCRNLLIYMTPFLQKKIFSMLLFGLRMNGYLFLGSSENPTSIIQSLQVVNKKWRIYKNVNAKRIINFDTFSLPESLNFKAAVPVKENVSRTNGHNISEIICGVLANEMDYLAVCIDENQHVVKSYGNTSKYLLQQNFNSYLPELLPEQLLLAFNSLSSQVLKTNNAAGVKGIPVDIDGQDQLVRLSIMPLKIERAAVGLFLVVFERDFESVAVQNEYPVFDERVYNNMYVSNLEHELKELKDKLYAAYETIDAYNENMQSFNEELISSNEEMQSTNEEMQSVNEELHTINADYQIKNRQLLEINDDLNNYFRSNINSQLFVNEHLLLMKFSPAAVQLINLQESDIGRPLSHISGNIPLDGVIEDIWKVIQKGEVISRAIAANNGLWYQIMVMPYIQQADNKRTGAIITFNDITELKRAKLELDEKNESLMRINADLDHFIHIVSHDLLEPLGSIESSIAIMNEMDMADPELSKYMEITRSSIKKFRSLIRNMGAIAKLENNMSDMEFVDIEDIINNIKWSLDGRIKSSHAVITTQLDVKEIFFSKRNLRSMLYNMISNAIKFSKRTNPLVHIHTWQEEDFIVLSVEDNGIGISKEGIARIFDVYGRLNNDIEGNGVGLYLARKLVHAVGGDMIVESEPGKGSKFMIYLRSKKRSSVSDIGLTNDLKEDH
ncbi:chemotaxis protein CheB [Chitinophaga agri]|uniref:histidine kinase n=1 Tax=Chitinophaga agri TaxID=2703787 RepID=A0A6B9ZM33_9BACT|nr:chemotaxis protein CheB [Chitinophaga agri]QHS63490.1 chemotaxis protein CheR [Chitinophaga agri]